MTERTGRPGLLVAVEGPGGVGKSTVTAAVAGLLAEQGVPVLATREPTDTPLGDLARHGTDEYRGMALACLVAAGRYQHAEEIQPALDRGKVVVCDRYIASSLALQCMDGVDRDFIWLLNEGVIQPDLTVMLTAPPEVLAERLATRGALHSRFEVEDDTRLIELGYFIEAGRYLRDRGAPVLAVEATIPPSEAARPVVAAITRLMKDHR
ncbi:dTMP kinase [Streptomyces sp. NPDC005963]|uniref:dTMP kinase n=1 Tax=Streptomyces sp. NPDC005963 TaxID=3156721 RepID=UPI0033E2B9BA